MGDVEEGEIVEADRELNSPKPLVDRVNHSRCLPEIVQKSEGSRRFWPERRGIESFDYKHGRWMDRQMISARRQERSERANFLEQSRGRRVGLNEGKLESVQDCNADFHRGERPKLDARLAPQQRHIRAPYFGRKRRPMPHHRGGHIARRGYLRGRFRNDSQQMPVNYLQVNDPWEAGDSQTRRHTVYDHGTVPQVSTEEGGMFQNRGHIPYQHRSDETFMERFERLDKSREENLRLSERSNVNETAMKGANGDEEYNLDEYQLLLERHRLIQQQLSAIGEKERSLQQRMHKEPYFGDSSDFEVIPNPNSPGDNIFIMQQHVEGRFDQNFDACSQIENSRSVGDYGYLGAEQTVYQYGSQSNMHSQEHRAWNHESNGVYADANACFGTFNMPLHELNSAPSLSSTLMPPAPIAKSKSQRKRARRKRLKLRQNLKAMKSSNSNPSANEHIVTTGEEQNRYVLFFLFIFL